MTTHTPADDVPAVNDAAVPTGADVPTNDPQADDLDALFDSFEVGPETALCW